jgi:hypothetical protein
LKIASYTSVSGDHIEAQFEGKVDDSASCCYKWKVTVSAETNDPKLDPEAEADNMVVAINSGGAADGISVESHEEGTGFEKPSGSARVVVGWVAAFLAVLACFM